MRLNVFGMIFLIFWLAIYPVYIIGNIAAGLYFKVPSPVAVFIIVLGYGLLLLQFKYQAYRSKKNLIHLIGGVVQPVG